jgi:serine/threonine-protein kinase
MSPTRKRFSLKLLGGCRLEGPEGPVGGRAAQRRRLAVLALVAAAGPAGVTRDRVVAMLWPESGTEPARHLLADTLYVLRSALGEGAVVTAGDRLAVNADVVDCDVLAFDAAVGRRDHAAAVALYAGSFLDGFHVGGAPDFARWADGERDRLHLAYATALESLAADAGRSGDAPGAAGLWRRAAATRPYDSRVARELAEALDAAGDRAGAITHLRAHTALLRADLEAAPDAALLALAERLHAARGSPLAPATAVAAPEPAAVGAAPAEAPPTATSPPSTAERLPAPTAPTAAPEVAPADAPAAPARPRRARRRRWPDVAAGLLVAVTAVGAWRVWAGRDGATAPPLVVNAAEARRAPVGAPARGLDARVVAVAPFRTGGADPALGYLREGMLDLLAAKLTGDGGPRATEPRALLGAWRAFGPGPDPELSTGGALGVARTLGAGRLLLGGVVGTPRRLVLTASLLEVPNGSVRARATAEGPQDSLSALVDRLAAQLLVGETGEAAERQASLGRVPLRALQAYLAGQAAHRRGEFAAAASQFDHALDADSSFALAALALVRVSWTPELNYRGPAAQAAAWALRHRLHPRDRALLDAYVGRGYPARMAWDGSRTMGEHLAAWERARDAAPDRAEPWVEIGGTLFRWGPTLAAEQPRAVAVAAFERALALDPSYEPARDALLHAALYARDTAAVRRYATHYLARAPAGDHADAVRWHAAYVLGDRAGLSALRARFDRMSSDALNRIAGLGPQLAGWFPEAVDDAERAAALLHARPRTFSSTMVWLLDMNRGRPGASRVAVAPPASRRAVQDRVATALYWDADTLAAREAARALAVTAHAPPAADRREREMQLRDLCVLEQWRLAHANVRTTPQAVRVLRAAAAGDPDAVDPATRQCAALLDAMLAVHGRRPDARAAVDTLDALLLRDGGYFGSPPFDAHARNLVLARLRAELGDARGGLAAARRRPYQTQFGSFFLSSYLREEGRLAALAGDRAGAVRAYRHYLLLRAAPEPALRAEAERVRAELARIESGPPRR